MSMDVDARVLVTYGSWTGSTAEVAEAVAEELRELGASVDAVPAGSVSDVAAYSLVVIGTPVRASRLHGDVTALVRRLGDGLRAMPVVLFVSCLTMKEDTEESRRKSLEFLAPLVSSLPDVEVARIGLFGGAVFSSEERIRKLPLRERLILRVMRSQRGDYRNWDSIRDWARRTVGGLVMADRK